MLGSAFAVFLAITIGLSLMRNWRGVAVVCCIYFASIAFCLIAGWYLYRDDRRLLRERKTKEEQE